MAMTMPAAMYAPASDVMDRHEYGITKSRKSSSTGGGRAWSEDEVCDLHCAAEMYLPFFWGGGGGFVTEKRKACLDFDTRLRYLLGIREGFMGDHLRTDKLNHNRKFTCFRPACRRCRTSTSPLT